MGSSPCGRLSLLGIAHPIVGKTFQVLEVHQEKALHEDGQGWLVLYFINVWAENPIFAIYLTVI